MNNATSSTQTIRVYASRNAFKKRIGCLTPTILLILGLDCLVAWIFWHDASMNIGTFVIIALAIMGTFFLSVIISAFIRDWRQVQMRQSAIEIGAEGLHIDYWAHLGKIFVPWPEIEEIVHHHKNSSAFFSIKLKNALHWWSTFEDVRKLRHAVRLGSQLNIPEEYLSMTVEQILPLIVQHFPKQLKRHRIQLVSPTFNYPPAPRKHVKGTEKQ